MLMMNRNKLAKLHYMAGQFRILATGDHVLCAISGEPIALDELRYWSVAKQEAYSSVDLSVQAALGKK